MADLERLPSPTACVKAASTKPTFIRGTGDAGTVSSLFTARLKGLSQPTNWTQSVINPKNTLDTKKTQTVIINFLFSEYVTVHQGIEYFRNSPGSVCACWVKTRGCHKTDYTRNETHAVDKVHSEIWFSMMWLCT